MELIEIREFANIGEVFGLILVCRMFLQLIWIWRNTAPSKSNYLNPIPGFISRGTYVSLSAFGVSDSAYV